MASVTQRIRVIKQPKGGFINPKNFKIIEYNSEINLHECENVHPSLVGLAVDYLSRFIVTNNAIEAFKISGIGAKILKLEQPFSDLLSQVKGLDDCSIVNAVKLSCFDCAFRAGPHTYKPFESVNPNSETISNIRIMVERSINFFRRRGPIIEEGFIFPGGYTKIIDAGDGDFLTRDTLWDFKVSKNDITKDHTLQLLVYYLMGIHSKNEKFKLIRKIGIFNPRLNKEYILDVKDISYDVQYYVARYVIGYSKFVKLSSFK